MFLLFFMIQETRWSVGESVSSFAVQVLWRDESSFLLQHGLVDWQTYPQVCGAASSCRLACTDFARPTVSSASGIARAAVKSSP
jgi:hypothetical protein